MNMMSLTTSLPDIKVKEFDLGHNACGLRKLSGVVVPDHFFNRMSFGVDVLDIIFNGDGVMKGQTFTVAAPRGSGKTTLLMQAMQKLIDNNFGLRCAYFSNEECVEQLAFTAGRIGVTDLMADNAKDIDHIVELMQKLDVIVIDSFPGLTHLTITQAKAKEMYAINTIIKAAKATGCVIIFVMHFTKAGLEAGSKNVYHAVDTCIRITKLEDGNRLIEVDKNRFGAQAEVTLTMTPTGFDLDNPVEAESDPKEEKTATAARKEADVKAIVGKVRSMPLIGAVQIQAQFSDFTDLGIDIGRVTRLLKELSSSNQLVQTGYGKGKRWQVPLDSDE